MRDRLVRLWEGLGDEHRAFAAQVARYGVVGVGVTLFQITLYNLGLGAGHMAPLIANTVATAVTMLVGYTIHSRFTFDGHGSGASVARTGSRFFVANMIGFAVNSLWVWLFSAVLHWSPHLASLPVFSSRRPCCSGSTANGSSIEPAFRERPRRIPKARVGAFGNTP